MVTVELPVAAVLLAESVNTLVVALVVLKDGVTPAGNPDAVKVTAPVNPLIGVTVMPIFGLVALVVPGLMATMLGEAERLKSGAAAALTLSETVVV